MKARFRQFNSSSKVIRSRAHEPSFSHRRLRFGGLLGTFKRTPALQSGPEAPPFARAHPSGFEVSAGQVGVRPVVLQ